jgi:nicotinamide riboside kinase
MKVINVIAGPGAGKSTLASGLYNRAKCRGWNVELVTEVAKDLVWEGRSVALANQAYVFGRQVQRLERLKGKVDLVITDSPFLLSAIYAPQDYPEEWESVVVKLWKGYDNVVAFLERGPWFDDRGRVHNLEASLEVDRQIAVLLAKHDITYTQVNHGYHNLDAVLDAVLAHQASVGGNLQKGGVLCT